MSRTRREIRVRFVHEQTTFGTVYRLFAQHIWQCNSNWSFTNGWRTCYSGLNHTLSVGRRTHIKRFMDTRETDSARSGIGRCCSDFWRHDPRKTVYRWKRSDVLAGFHRKKTCVTSKKTWWKILFALSRVIGWQPWAKKIIKPIVSHRLKNCHGKKRRCL